MIKAAPAAPRPALPAPGSALGGPPGAPAPSRTDSSLDQQPSAAGRNYRLPRSRLSGSRPPRPGPPCGPSHAIGYAYPGPGSHSPASVADNDGRNLAVERGHSADDPL